MGNQMTSIDVDELSRQRVICRSDLGDKWPLTVERGLLHCTQAGEVVFVTGGIAYALNGIASANPAYANVWPIWADDPECAGLKIGIGDLIAEGLQLDNPSPASLLRRASAQLAVADRLCQDPDASPGAANIAKDRAVLFARKARIPELAEVVGVCDDDMDPDEAADRLRAWCEAHGVGTD